MLCSDCRMKMYSQSTTRVVLRLQCPWASSAGLGNTQGPGLPPQSFWFSKSGLEPKNLHSNKFPGETDVAGSWATHWQTIAAQHCYFVLFGFKARFIKYNTSDTTVALCLETSINKRLTRCLMIYVFFLGKVAFLFFLEVGGGRIVKSLGPGITTGGSKLWCYSLQVQELMACVQPLRLSMLIYKMGWLVGPPSQGCWELEGVIFIVSSQ